MDMTYGFSSAARTLFQDLQPLLVNLADRWRDESAYEDINDYAAALRPAIEKAGGQLVRMSKRPFGVVLTLEGDTLLLRVGARTYSMERVPAHH